MERKSVRDHINSFSLSYQPEPQVYGTPQKLTPETRAQLSGPVMSADLQGECLGCSFLFKIHYTC